MNNDIIVQNYIDEFTALSKKAGSPDFKMDDMKAQFDDFYTRIENESDAVQFEAAMRMVQFSEVSIDLVGTMPDELLGIAQVQDKLIEKMPKDITLAKRGIAVLEKTLGDHLSPRIAFYYSAIKKLPDYSEDNPKATLDAMRQAAKKFTM